MRSSLIRDDGDVQLHLGDAEAVLRTLPEESCRTCVTSPPYWGLRDYGTATWEGGEPECEHTARPLASTASTLTGNRGTGVADTDKLATNGVPYRETCGKCGARRVDAQLGLEPTPQEYVARMVEVFREVRRVLRDDGTLWLNLGDSYANDGKWGGASGGKHASALHGDTAIGRRKTRSGLKPKDLVGIPWRVAFALQDDGWYLRSDIVWSKPNPMPESVTDRPTKAHEYLFLLAKSARYFYDARAIREPLVSTPEQYAKAGKSVRENHAFGSVAGRPLGPSSFATVPDGRNARSVWTITTKPYAGAHFATFPPELPERCIKAGSAEADTVLDPFCGSGTTLAVARQLGRRAIGIDLNADYLELAGRRLQQLSLFAQS